MEIMILSVDGGETTELLGAFKTREGLDAVIARQREQMCIRDEDGYEICLPQIDEEGNELLNVVEQGEDPDHYVVAFIIKTTTLGD